jgi:hypothetical protein
VYIDRTKDDVNVVAPHALQELPTREDLARVIHEVPQEPKFDGTDMNLSVVAKESMRLHIHPNVEKADGAIGTGNLRWLWLEYAAEPRDEFAGGEWF